ncbi:hypothetical protein Pla175_28180 [Pirellulimonas nuda]|uniref:Uncharacterized protein n=1 Tax=Pirellulimonas nuda TaxID=2528009 RepID=A0A518DD78_9BACT|nr:hypothetical protein [Pirellulimonas nuda]QDU89428.1 hypothetical protein Pla175_28180 [Pirellulimonas nuda]
MNHSHTTHPLPPALYHGPLATVGGVSPKRPASEEGARVGAAAAASDPSAARRPHAIERQMGRACRKTLLRAAWTCLQLTVLLPLMPVILLAWLCYFATRGGETDPLQNDVSPAEAGRERFEPPQVGVL